MRVFRSLSHPNFRLHVIGQTISLMGTWMQRIAISWMVFDMTNSVFWLGFVSFVSLSPSLFLAPFIGSFVDRHGKYRLVFKTQIGLMIQTGLLATLVFFGKESVWLLAMMGFLQGVINTFDVVGRQSLLGFLVPDKRDLPNAIALNSTVFNSARMVGPAVGGMLLSFYGEFACFLINFLSFGPVLYCLSKMRVVERRELRSTESTWRGLVEGYQYLRRSSHISSLILILVCSSLLVIPYSSLLPAVARVLFDGDEAVFSWFESMAGLGAMLGAFSMARLGSGTNLRYRVMGSALLMGSGILLLAQSTVLGFALLYTMLVGFAMMVQNSSINTYIQTHAVPLYRARTMSYYVMAFQGVFPLGSLLIGSLAELLGIRQVLYLMGSAGVLLSVGYYTYLRFRIHRRLFGFRTRNKDRVWRRNASWFVRRLKR